MPIPRNVVCFVPTFCRRGCSNKGIVCHWKRTYKSLAKAEFIRASKSGTSDSWAEFAQKFRGSPLPLPTPWGEVFEPLRTGRVDDLVVVAQIGQSLDGRIATASGHSKYVNGPAGLVTCISSARSSMQSLSV